MFCLLCKNMNTDVQDKTKDFWFARDSLTLQSVEFMRRHNYINSDTIVEFNIQCGLKYIDQYRHI